MGFTLYPAIDLKQGQCVRLYKGDMAQATVYSDAPATQAAAFVAAGAEWLQVVDLDGAFAGEAVNAAAVKAIIAAASVPVQLGGGIRRIEQIDAWLEAGVSRVILGTIAVKQPEVVTEACRLFPGKVAVGIDAREGMVAVEGWAEASSLTARELAQRFEGQGVSAIIYTDIGRDGTLTGVNLEETVGLAKSLSIPVIASGGVAGLEDIQALLPHASEGVQGAICGRALYDGRLDLAGALDWVRAHA